MLGLEGSQGLGREYISVLRELDKFQFSMAASVLNGARWGHGVSMWLLIAPGERMLIAPGGCMLIAPLLDAGHAQ